MIKIIINILILKNTKFKFVLSYENCEEVKKLYDWTYINELDWTYFMSEARRQNGKELLITNFKIKLDDFIKNKELTPHPLTNSSLLRKNPLSVPYTIK